VSGQLKAVGRFRKPTDMLISALGVAALVTILVAMDQRVQNEILGLMTADGPRTGASVYRVGMSMFASAHDLVTSHSPLATFVVVAAALVLVMLRL